MGIGLARADATRAMATKDFISDNRSKSSVGLKSWVEDRDI
jgi:hypothetical protein